MNPLFRTSRPGKLLAVVAAVGLLSTGGLFANYGAFASSTGRGSFGIYGLSWNWRTPNAAITVAVNSARNANRGYLNGYRYVWWGQRGWEAGARGFNYYGNYVNFGWARGWGTRNSAINYAVSRLGYNTYGLSYRSGYNW